MTDVEISKALALAIGWQTKDIQVWTPQKGPHAVYIKTFYGWPHPNLTDFDYLDPTVIWPIAKRYGYPSQGRDGLWSVSLFGPPADTPEKAVALAVIHGALLAPLKGENK